MKIHIEAMLKAIRARQGMVRVFFALGLLAIVYQNCSQVRFQGSASGALLGVDSSSMGGTGQIVINNGDLYTNSINVNLGLESQNAVDMYITNEPGCTDGGSWESMAASKSWMLKEMNKTTYVYGKFRNASGGVTDCVSAHIFQDGIAPVVAFVKTPDTITRSIDASFEITGDDGAGSGVAAYICRLDGAAFVTCPETYEYKDLADGRHTAAVRAIDRAGNMSPIVEYSWIIDTTKPIVRIIDPKPPKASNSTTATFNFEASDADGSGVDRILCKWDNQTAVSCRNTDTRTGIPVGSHTFQVVAYDSAGNESDPAVYTWDISLAGPGSFQITGITGGSDTQLDHYLSSGTSPTVNWSAAENATTYSVSVVNSQSQVVCPVKTTSQLAYPYSAADCQLQDGGSYIAKASAVNTFGNVTVADPFSFQVDLSGPVITVQTPIVSSDQTTAKVDFTVTDAVSGVDTSTCFRKFGSNTETIACEGKTSLTFTNLPVGDHQFWIEATDKVGHSSASTPVVITIKNVVCDPFSTTPGATCVKGLIGELFYQPNMPANFEQAMAVGWADVNTYITQGTKANAVLFLPDLSLGTTDFDRGFITANNDVVRDNQGNKLFEWFALQLTSVIKLASADTSGDYQFAVLSDDGTRVFLKDASASTFTQVIENNGQHATQMGCTTQAIAMTQSTRKAIKLQYFQGPRQSIALQLLYRKAPADGSADVLCGKEQDLTKTSQPYFSAYKNGASQPGQWTTDLKNRGWKVLSSDNYVTQGQ